MNQFNTLKVFLILCLVYLIPNIILDFVIIDEIDYINFFVGRIPDEKLEDFINSLVKWRWLVYVLTALVLLVKTYLVGSIIWITTFLTSKKFPFKWCWKTAMYAQFVFSIKGYILIIQYGIFDNFDLTHLQTFHPLSLASFLAQDNYDAYFSFLFQSINLFEFVYWFLLAYFISKLINTNFQSGFKLVLSSYIPAFALWLVAVTFLLVSNS